MPKRKPGTSLSPMLSPNYHAHPLAPLFSAMPEREYPSGRPSVAASGVREPERLEFSLHDEVDPSDFIVIVHNRGYAEVIMVSPMEPMNRVGAVIVRNPAGDDYAWFLYFAHRSWSGKPIRAAIKHTAFPISEWGGPASNLDDALRQVARAHAMGDRHPELKKVIKLAKDHKRLPNLPERKLFAEEKRLGADYPFFSPAFICPLTIIPAENRLIPLPPYSGNGDGRQYNTELMRSVLTRKKGKCIFFNCNAEAIGGHLIPKGWMSQDLAANGEVYSAPYLSKLRRKKFQGIPKDYLSEEDIYRFMPTGINETFVGSFSCKTHDDGLFKPVDTPNFDTGVTRNLNLMNLRTVSWKLWRAILEVDSLRRMTDRHPDFNPLNQVKIGQMLSNIVGLIQVKVALEDCLRSATCALCIGKGCRLFTHDVYPLGGKPSVAVADCCDGDMSPLSEGATKRFPYWWAYHVIPASEGTVAVCSYITDQVERIDAISQVRRHLATLGQTDLRLLQQQFSKDILENCGNIVIGKSVWEGWDEDKQSAILHHYTTIPDMDVDDNAGTVVIKGMSSPDLSTPCPDDVNLFDR